MTGEWISEVMLDGVKTGEEKNLKKQPEGWNSVLYKIPCKNKTEKKKTKKKKQALKGGANF